MPAAQSTDGTARPDPSRLSDNIISGQLRMYKDFIFLGAGVEAIGILISIDRIVSLGQVGLLARIWGAKILAAHTCTLAERQARPMRIAIPAA